MPDQPENPAGTAAADGPVQTGSAPEQVLDVLQNVPEGALFWDDLESPLYLFAYDHLMDQAYISRFVRGLRPAKQVRLPHHRLCWPYYFPPQATAVPALERTNREEDEVWGILYQANHVDLSRLEEHMRVPNRYYRKSVIVMDRGDRRLAAFCYTLNHEPQDAGKPSPAYIQRLVEAAVVRSLPAEWISKLGAIETG
jgi:hypothetical protein